MAKKQVTLVFPQDLIKEPLVYTMAREFQVVPNVRRAKVNESVGEITLEIEGDDDNLGKAIEFLQSKGVKVEPVVGDIVS